MRVAPADMPVGKAQVHVSLADVGANGVVHEAVQQGLVLQGRSLASPSVSRTHTQGKCSDNASETNHRCPCISTNNSLEHACRN